MKKEYLDIVDENGEVLGSEKREILHKSPDKIHPVVQIIITNSKSEVLIQLRSRKKEFGAGLWEASVGGHVDSGEKPKDAALRELEEELGIKTELSFVTKKVFTFHNEKELSYLFLGSSEGPFTIDKVEIEKVKFVNLENIPKFFQVDKHGEISMLELWYPIIKETLSK